MKEMTFFKDNFIRIYQPNNTMDRASYGLLFHKIVLIFKKKNHIDAAQNMNIEK